MIRRFDVIVVGAGPAGSVCAATLAKEGKKVLLLDRAKFPRDKVCGDCLNPSVWPIIDRLELRSRLLALPHSVIETIGYHAIDGTVVNVPAPAGPFAEITLKRRDLDALLVERATELGTEFQDGVAVIHAAERWTVSTNGGEFAAPFLVAADGRHSVLARLAGRLPRGRRERVAIQCHCPRPAGHGREVRMFFRPHGYGGSALVSEQELNLCLVAPFDRIEQVREAATREFSLPADTEWRTITPLARDDASDVARDGMFLTGDAARVVEPFTGEGIYYAMRSGELAAQAIVEGNNAEVVYRREHAQMYRRRLWVNRLARLAALHPRITSRAIYLLQNFPAPLRLLTRHVLRAPQT